MLAGVKFVITFEDKSVIYQNLKYAYSWTQLKFALQAHLQKCPQDMLCVQGKCTAVLFGIVETESNVTVIRTQLNELWSSATMECYAVLDEENI